jgi:hypothetical protein
MSKKSKAKAKAAKRFAVNQVAKESLSAVPSQEQVAADDELVMDAPTAHPTSEPCNLEDAPVCTYRLSARKTPLCLSHTLSQSIYAGIRVVHTASGRFRHHLPLPSVIRLLQRCMLSQAPSTSAPIVTLNEQQIMANMLVRSPCAGCAGCTA